MAWKQKTVVKPHADVYRARENYYYTSGVFKDDVDVVRAYSSGVTARNLSSTIGADYPENHNWREKIRRHQNATTVLDGTIVRVEKRSKFYADCYWIARDPRLPSSVPGQLKPMFTVYEGAHPFGVIPTAPTTVAVNTEASLEAKLRLLGKLRDARSSFEGGVFLGELAETLRMLRNPLESLRKGFVKYIDDVKKRRRGLKRVSDLNRMIGGTWLEFVFGVKPLLSDLDGISETLGILNDKYESTYKRFAVQVEMPDGPLESLTSYTVTCGLLTLRLTRWLQNFSEVRWYGQVYVAGKSVAGMARAQWGLTLHNFLPTVYELIPYSFLIDYGTNLGRLVNASSTYTGDVAWISSGYASSRKSVSIMTSGSFDIRNLTSSSIRDVRRRVLLPSSPFVISASRVRRQPDQVPTVNPFTDFRLRLPEADSLKYLNVAALVATAGSAQRGLIALSRRG